MVLACLVLLSGVVRAEAPRLPATSDRELIVGTRSAPPFAMKNAEGHWEGISIDLWRHLADQLHLRYRLEERGTVAELLDAVVSGQVDVVTAAVTVTAERRKAMDFTQPFYSTGLGIAVARGGVTAWFPVVRTFISFRFLQAVLILLAIALLVGTLVWIFERRENEHYGGGPIRGFVAGAWWSAVAMTQAGAAQQGPRSTPGRVLAVIWMVASVVTIAVFIAGITSALTTQRLQGVVRNVHDLGSIRVGAVAGSSTEGFLTGQRIQFRAYRMATDGLHAVQSGQIDAFVYDRPLLAWALRQGFPDLELAAVTLGSENYAIVLPIDNTIREELDVTLLNALRSDWWKETRFRYLGADSGD